MIAITVLIAVAAAVALFGGAYYVYRCTFYADRRKIDDPFRESSANPKLKIDRERIIMLTREICEAPHEDVQTVSFDGLKLRGRFYPAQADGNEPNDAPITILMHGYRSLGARDFCGTFRIFKELGHSILMIDQRAHGASDGHTISFGIFERYDCKAWVDYVTERFGKERRIILVGFSMGAASVLMASSLELSENVCGIIADSGYSSPEEIIGKVARDRHLPQEVICFLAKIGAYLFGHFGLNDSSAENEVKSCKVPILLLHGEEDYFVPSIMSRKIFAAADSDKQIEIFPNNGHCASYIFNTERYIKTVKEFCKKCLNAEKQNENESRE